MIAIRAGCGPVLADFVKRRTTSTVAPAAAAEAHVEAGYILAFSAARRHDLKLARQRFADTHADAIQLLPAEHASPEHPLPGPGQDPAPTLEESSAYQHAVCTAALGDKPGAEREYVAFIQNYPDSPLVQAATMRVEQTFVTLSRHDDEPFARIRRVRDFPVTRARCYHGIRRSG